MLTYHEFQALNEDMQTQLLSLDGVYLDLNRSKGRYHIELYALYNFYVEIFFERSTEEPMYLKAFQKMKSLDPYLEMIDIGEILRIREEGF
jgi:hypothetical protein